MASPLILIANPGSASRKYALYEGEQELASLHFEWRQGQVVCTLSKGPERQELQTDTSNLQAATGQVVEILQSNGVLEAGQQISGIGLRVVAPGAYFLEDHIIDDDFVFRLQAALPRAPLHIAASLQELLLLRQLFSSIPIVGVSDSGFHITKPDYAWNYGIPLEDADSYDVKRFGYHGLSVASVVHTLKAAQKLPPKLIVCHLGSGVSITAVHGGKSLDTTMGYSPLEGVIMATRSGNIDATAVRTLKEIHNLDDAAVEDYLNNHSGLQGLGGSSDVRELLQREANGETRASLALTTYIYSIQKAVGQMAAALGGADALAFAGTIGERSDVIRHRITSRLHYLDFILDQHTNQTCQTPEDLATISRLAHSKPVYVIPAQESAEMGRHVLLTQ